MTPLEARIRKVSAVCSCAPKPPEIWIPDSPPVVMKTLEGPRLTVTEYAVCPRCWALPDPVLEAKWFSHNVAGPPDLDDWLGTGRFDTVKFRSRYVGDDNPGLTIAGLRPRVD